VERHLDSVDHFGGQVVGKRLQPLDGRFGLPRGVEREGRVVLAVAAPIGVPRVLFLQVTAVGQEQRRKLPRARGAEHAPDQPWAHSLGRYPV